jgi:hypothetical protein
MSEQSFEDFIPEIKPTGKERPPVILVFAILTFIWSGISFLTFLILSVRIEDQVLFPVYVSLLTMLGSGAKIVGASMMIPMKKWGFWLYAIAEGFLVVMWYASIQPVRENLYELSAINFQGKSQDYYEMAASWHVFPTFFVVFSIAWITVYASQLKKMN